VSITREKSATTTWHRRQRFRGTATGGKKREIITLQSAKNVAKRARVGAAHPY